MKKLALIIGVSEYQPGLNLLPGVVKDVEGMQRVLRHPNLGGFDEVKPLINPDATEMQEAIETFLSDCTKDDLALLFFSGHGLKDDVGDLFFATRTTRKTAKGELLKASTVSASFVRHCMDNADCNRQVLILDCCFSGAFPYGKTSSEPIDLQALLGGEGRAVLSSSTSTQVSLVDQQGSDLSLYTRFIVDGIELGAADTNRDGSISVVELHDYAKLKVRASTRAMKPEIYLSGEAHTIVIAKTPVFDAKLIYRREAEYLVRQGQTALDGSFSDLARNFLNVLREHLTLTIEVATAIETDVLKPYQEYREKRQHYHEIFTHVAQRRKEGDEATRHVLIRLQDILGLGTEDVAAIEAAALEKLSPQASTDSAQEAISIASTPADLERSPKQVKHPSKSTKSSKARPIKFALAGVGVSVLSATTGIYFRLYKPLPLPIQVQNVLDQVSDSLNRQTRQVQEKQLVINSKLGF